MEFTIYDELGINIDLLVFDKKFCDYIGVNIDADNYNYWHFYLDLACKYKAQFADEILGRSISSLEGKVIQDASYSLTGEEVARVLAIITTDFAIKNGSKVGCYMDLINFWLLPENKDLKIIFRF